MRSASDGGFRRTGFTQLVPPEWVDVAREKVAMHRALGIDTDFIPQNRWGERFPWLNPEGVGAIVFEQESGYADPIRTTEAFVDTLCARGRRVSAAHACARADPRGRSDHRCSARRRSGERGFRDQRCRSLG